MNTDIGGGVALASPPSGGMSVEEFLVHHHDYHRVSPVRRRRAEQTLRRYEAFAGHPVAQVTAESLRAWLGSLVAEGLHPNTIVFLANHVRLYARVAWESGQMDDVAYTRLRAVRNPSGAAVAPPRPYALPEVEELLGYVDERYPYSPRKLRNHATLSTWEHYGRSVSSSLLRLQTRAMVFLALDCGLRGGELLRVECDDISAENRSVLVRGAAKGRAGLEIKLREVPHSARSRKACGEWLNARRWFHENVDPLQHQLAFIMLRRARGPKRGEEPGAPLSEQPMRRLIYPWAFHRLRHTCATNWLRSGMPLERVSRLLGHSDTDTTLGYTKILAEDVIEAAGVAHERFMALTGGENL